MTPRMPYIDYQRTPARRIHSPMDAASSRRRRVGAVPPMWEFVFLSMLLHAFAIALFGAPGGGSREGRAMWGALQVVLPGALPQAGPRLRFDRELIAPAPAPSPRLRSVPRPPVGPHRRSARHSRSESKPAPPSVPKEAAPPALPAAAAPVAVPPDVPPVALPELAPPVALPELAPPVALPELAPPVALPELAPSVERAPAQAPPIAVPLLEPVSPPSVETLAPEPLENAPAAQPPAPETPSQQAPVQQAPIEAPPIAPNPAPERAPEQSPPLPTSPAPATLANPEATREPPAGIEPELAPSPFRSPPAPATPATAPPASPGLDLEALRKRAGEIAREGSGQRAVLPFPMPPVPPRKSKMETAIENARKPDCRTAYQSLGLAAIVPLIANEFGEGNCRW